MSRAPELPKELARTAERARGEEPIRGAAPELGLRRDRQELRTLPRFDARARVTAETAIGPAVEAEAAQQRGIDRQLR